MEDIFQWLTLVLSLLSTVSTLILTWLLFKKEHNKLTSKNDTKKLYSQYLTYSKIIFIKKRELLMSNKQLTSANILLTIIN